MRRATMSALAATAFASFVQATALGAQDGFPHEKHSVFFAECTACHAGVTTGDADAVYPEFATCGGCHDGNTGPVIEWQAPESRASSLAFDHAPHAFDCATCHLPGGEDDLASMAYPEPESCFGCHAPDTQHQQAEDCGFCHARVTSFRLTQDGAREPFHGVGFVNNHGAAASAGQPDCASCHAENTCAQCHEAQAEPDFHPVNFLASHGPEAYGRTSDCTSCHSSEAFCRECHVNLGMEGGGGFVAPFHDNQAVWILSHPQAARQDLESCVSCHQQNDCLRCHSGTAGMRVSPHGPDFDPSAMRQRNQAMCTVCHGSGGGGL